jgi:hypothetical protein
VRPLQITDLVAEQPAGSKSVGAAAAPSVNSVGPKTAAGAKEKGNAFGLAISTMNEHLRASQPSGAKRAWPERLTSNKDAASLVAGARAKGKGKVAKTSE